MFTDVHMNVSGEVVNLDTGFYKPQLLACSFMSFALCKVYI